MEEGNYLAALNMFSYSIALEPNLPISYIDRSSAHFELNNLHKSIEDATKVFLFIILTFYRTDVVRNYDISLVL